MMLITREILGSEIMTKYIKDRLKDNILYQSTKYLTASCRFGFNVRDKRTLKTLLSNII